MSKTKNTVIAPEGEECILSEAEQLKNGYAEMAQINLELAQMCFDADEEASRQYEENLKHGV